MIKNLLAKALLLFGLLSSSVGFAQSTITISVGPGGTNTYSPANVSCTVGDTIKFVWVSGFHPTQSLDLTTIPLVNMDGSGGVNSVYKIKMLSVGSVPYECTAHGGMVGTITVNAPFTPTSYIPFTGTGSLTSNNWTTHSGTTGQLLNLTTASDNGNSLSYVGMPTSTDNRTQIVAGNSEDINRIVPIVNSGSVYYSALIKLPNTTGQAANTTTGNYFLHLNDSSGATGITNLFARLTIRLGSAPNTFNLGIVNNSGGTASTATQVFGATPVDYAINQTYLVVVKYNFATNTASLWVNPTISSTEPTALHTNNVGTTAATKAKTICIRQAGNTTAGTGNIEIDEIRVANSWNSVLGIVSNPSIKFNPTSLTVNENAGTATVTVNITNPNSNATSGTVVVKGGSASAGTDYTFTSQTVTFPASSTTAQTFTFPIIDDTNTEGDETIILALRNATNSGTVEADSVLTITIPANDAVNPSILFNPTTASVNEGAGTATVTVNITNPNASATSGTVVIKGGTASAGSDYTFTSQTVTFPASSTTAQTFTFPIIDDTNTEGDETIILALRNATNSASITADSIFTITIPANDAVVSNTPLLVENFNYTLNDTLTKVPATGWGVVSAAANRVPVSAGLTYPNSAGSGVGNGALLKTSGEDVGKAIPGNQIRTGNVYASFLMNVSSAQATGDYFFAFLDSALQGVNYRARVFVKSSGAGYRIGVTKSAAVAAAAFNSTDLNFNQTYQVVVKYSIIPGTGNDSVKLFVDPVLGSPEPASTSSAVTTESDITISSTVGIGGVALRQGSSANAAGLTVDAIMVGQTWASVTPFVVMQPTAVFNPTTLTVNENAGTATVTVNLANANANATSVTVVVKGGTANGVNDYTFTSQTVTFPANSTTAQTFTFPITDDVAMEGDETIVLALRNPTNSGVIGSDSILTVTIPANDFAGAVVHFSPAVASTVNENIGSKAISIMVMGAGTTAATSFDVVVKGGSATAGNDYTYTNTTYTIPAGKDSTLNINIPVLNDNLPEADETAIFAIRNITNSGTISTDSVYTLTIKSDDIPFKNISALKVNDVNGVSVLKDSAVYVKGIVYGVDMQGSATSLQYTLIDPTGGVGIFRSGASSPPIISLIPEEGDSVRVYGKVGEFNGLTQVNMDSIILISKGNALKRPRPVTKLDETTESDLVVFRNAMIIDTISNTGSGTTLRITNGNDSLDLRIDADVNLFNQPFPSAKFDVIGLGGQFDNSNPKNSGYQLLPRRLQDVIAVIDPTIRLDSSSFSVSEGAGTKTIKVKLSAPANSVTSIKLAVTGGTATSGTDYTFSSPATITINPGEVEGSTSFTITNDGNTETNETIVIGLNTPVNCVIGTPATATITIVDNDPQGLNNSRAIDFNLYPNPSNSIVNIESSEIIESINIVNTIGQIVKTVSSVNGNVKSINISDLSAGVYSVIVRSENGSSTKRLVIE